MIGSIMFLGIAFGAFFIVPLADYIGRKRLIIYTIPVMLLSCFGFIGVKTLPALYIVSLIFAITFLPRGVTSFLLLLETNVASKKTSQVMWSNVVEGCLIVCAALSLKHTKDLHMTVIIPLAVTGLIFLLFTCLTPESPEFLYQNKKTGELEACLRSIMKKNGCYDEGKLQTIMGKLKVGY
jgi:hypothetical protein